MLKYSSLVSVIALPDLLYSAQLIYSQTFETIPLLIVVSLWYLLCTSVLSVVQGYIERYYGRGVAGMRPDRPGRRGLRAGVRLKRTKTTIGSSTAIQEARS